MAVGEWMESFRTRRLDSKTPWGPVIRHVRMVMGPFGRGLFGGATFHQSCSRTVYHQCHARDCCDSRMILIVRSRFFFFFDIKKIERVLSRCKPHSTEWDPETFKQSDQRGNIFLRSSELWLTTLLVNQISRTKEKLYATPRATSTVHHSSHSCGPYSLCGSCQMVRAIGVMRLEWVYDSSVQIAFGNFFGCSTHVAPSRWELYVID